MKEKTLGTKLLLAAVTLGVLAYFSIQAVRYFGDPLTTTHRLPVSGGDVHGAVRLCGAGRGDPDGRHQRPAAAAAGGGRADQRRRRGGAGLHADQATLDRQKEIQSLHTQIERLQYAEEAALGAEVSLRLDAQISRRSATTGALWRRTGWTRRRTAEPSCGAW
ncbi:MAG: hypothetical protein ACLTG0_09120 [Oscillibacter sp.]